jgi:6-pyruvoyltetrahydropterin/6-carboxytetrahydropterin synthase
MYTISKEFHFSASHCLNGLPEEHPCSRVHGHNYIIMVELTAVKLNKTGFVVDYRDLQPIKDYIDNKLDHRHLNDVFYLNPTAENIAKILFAVFKVWFPQLSAVEVRETEKTKAIYRPEYDSETNY